MLWFKAWQDTRSRFLIGLAVLMVLAAGIVYDYFVSKPFLDQAEAMRARGPLRDFVRESILIQRHYQGFVWFQWFTQNLSQIGTLFAALLGSGPLLSRGSAATLFTLSLPVSRRRLLAVRGGVGLAEWLILATLPSLLIPLLSSRVGETYPVGDALAYSAFVFVAGSAFFSLAILLSTLFDDFLRPFMLTIAVALGLAMAEYTVPGLEYGIFRVMRGDSLFRQGVVPWAGLASVAGAAAVMLWSAGVRLARRDF